MIFQAAERFFPASLFQSSGTKMMAVEFDVAQRAEKTSTVFAGNDGFFVGVKKTCSLAVDHDRLRRGSRGRRREKRGEHLDLKRRVTRRARNRRRRVVKIGRE